MKMVNCYQARPWKQTIAIAAINARQEENQVGGTTGAIVHQKVLCLTQQCHILLSPVHGPAWIQCLT
jgi:hypothetical protein